MASTFCFLLCVAVVWSRAVQNGWSLYVIHAAPDANCSDAPVWVAGDNYYHNKTGCLLSASKCECTPSYCTQTICVDDIPSSFYSAPYVAEFGYHQKDCSGDIWHVIVEKMSTCIALPTGDSRLLTCKGAAPGTYHTALFNGPGCQDEETSWDTSYGNCEWSLSDNNTFAYALQQKVVC